MILGYKAEYKDVSKVFMCRFKRRKTVYLQINTILFTECMQKQAINKFR